MIVEAVKASIDDLICEKSAGVNIPIDLQNKTKEVAEKYVNNEARLYSIQNLFWELHMYMPNPMDVVSYVYNEIRIAVRGDFDTPPSGRLKRKAQKAYDILTKLAKEAKQKKKELEQK